MAKTDKKLGQLRLDLEQIREGLNTHQAEVGELAAAEVEITAVLDDLQTLNDEQERLKAATQEATARLKEKMTEGRDLRTRLRYALRGKFGPKSEKLEAFGIGVKSE